MLGTNPVGLLAVLAFVAFTFTYALAGPWAAGIAFWAVVLGLPAVIVVFSALGSAWRRTRRDEALEVARLAVRLATQRSPENRSSVSEIHLPLDDPEAPVDYPIKGDVKSGLYWTPGSSLYDDARAQIWFASEELAQANGFTRAG